MEALYDIYYGTNGDAWYWQDGLGQRWNFTSPNNNPCADSWQGIACIVGNNSDYSHVGSINLAGYNMVGGLPSSIGNLSWLHSLDLGDNVLTSMIPPTLCDMTQLVNISLNDNQLHGSIPRLMGAAFSNVAIIQLQNNLLSGAIPAFSADLVSLSELNLGDNALNSTIPSSLGDLPSLSAVYLGGNALTGGIPVSLFASTSLRILNLQDNHLTGPIPDISGPGNHMEFVSLRDNHLSGTLPESLGILENLRSISISNNRLAGSIPLAVSSWDKLFYLDFGHNEFTNSIPDALCGVSYLQNLNLEFNALTGAMPSCMGQLSKLTILNVGNNKLTGSLPDSISTLTLLAFAYFDCNLLNGQLPNTVPHLQSLLILNVSNNCFTGSIPTAFSRLSRLQVLLLENNALSGSLAGVFNASMQRNLTAVQVSNNQLTGSVPAEVFRIPSLTVFAAVSNCFDGSIPLTICNRTGLITLALDGLQSATSCQNKLLPGIVLRTSSYTVAKPIKGGIPECLFALPHLATLHLSGNGLTGELPWDVAISPSLTDLSLSHNNLKGDIPDSIQERPWSTLDLSYNLFTGTLSPKFSSEYTRNSSLYLEQNRLSGKIPISVVDIEEISILGSNLFACTADRSDLPKNNEDKDKYQCGSDAMNSSGYTWLFIVTVLFVLSVTVWWFRTTLDRCINVTINVRYLISWWYIVPPAGENTTEDSAELWAKLRNLSDSFEIYKIICITSLACTVYVMVLLVPLYVASKDYYGTFTHQYAWTTSVAFLSGHVPFSVTLVAYLVLLVLVLTIVLVLLHQRSAAAAERSSPLKSVSETFKQPSMLSYVTVYTAFASFNFTVTVGANVIYIYVALEKSDGLLYLAQILLSLFKFTLNSLVSPYLIHLLSRLALRYCEKHDRDIADAHFATAEFIPVQLFVALFNTIAIPCIVVSIISSNCFYNAFRQAPSVSSTFTYHGGCLQDSSEDISNMATLGCAGYEVLEATTSYSPPFKYTYQCSSSFITYYAPTYANLCMIASFVAPLGQVLLQRLHSRAHKGSLWFTFLDTVLPRSLKPLPTASTAASQDLTGADYISEMQRLIDPNAYPPFFNATQQLISILTYFGMLLTFGVVFPPLAVTFLVTIACVTAFARLKVGRLLHNAIAADILGVLSKVDRECRGVGGSWILRRSVRMVLVFSWCFYTLFLFDTLGDATGFQEAYWILIVMPVMPLCALVLYWLYSQAVARALARSAAQNEDASVKSKSIDSELELGRNSADVNTEVQVTFNVINDEI